MGTMYIGIGVFGHLRNVMNKEFARVGISKAMDKRGFLMEVIHEAPSLSKMSVSQMEAVIEALRKLPERHYAHLIVETEREKKQPNEFSLYARESRDSYGWSNQMFSAMTGISSHRLARICTGTIDATPDEESRVREAFKKWEEQNS